MTRSKKGRIEDSVGEGRYSPRFGGNAVPRYVPKDHKDSCDFLGLGTRHYNKILPPYGKKRKR
jgi:hypothetical protein